MRTALEIAIAPISKDLIDIVSLSKMIAARDGMKMDEACNFVTISIVHDDEEIEVFRTDKPGLPEHIGAVNSNHGDQLVLDAVWMPFKSLWWENSSSLPVIQAGRGGAPDSVAIRIDDADRILGLNLLNPETRRDFPDETNPELDPPELPEELDAANLAFRAVTNKYGDQSATFRNRLVDYLKNTFPKFKNDTVERIATVANPDKSPGRKPSRKNSHK